MTNNPLQNALEKAGKQISEDESVDITSEKNEATNNTKSRRREGTVLIGAHLPQSVQKQLKILSAEESKSHQELLTEALNLLFIQKGKKSIEEL